MNWIARWSHKLRALRHEHCARAAYAEERFDEALSHAHALYEFDLENPWANCLLACHHLEADRYAEALPHLERVALEWSDDPWTYDAIGICLDWTGRPRAAVSAFQRALEVDPDWISALKHMGLTLYFLNDYARAEQALQRYCAAAPEDKEAHDLLGYLCYRQGKFTASYAHYERARELDPLNPQRDRNARLLYTRSARS